MSESQNNDNQNEQHDQLTDLEPKGEIKAGTGTGQGGPVFNHNETLAVDESLADLETPDAEAVKGGPGLIVKKIGSGFQERGLVDLEATNAGEIKGGYWDTYRQVMNKVGSI